MNLHHVCHVNLSLRNFDGCCEVHVYLGFRENFEGRRGAWGLSPGNKKFFFRRNQTTVLQVRFDLRYPGINRGKLGEDGT